MNMLTLELRPYDPESDELRNGWDALSVEQQQQKGKISMSINSGIYGLTESASM